MSSGLHYFWWEMSDHLSQCFLMYGSFFFALKILFLVLSTLTIQDLGEIIFIFILIGGVELHENVHFCLSSKLENLGYYSSNIFSNLTLPLLFFRYYNYTWLCSEILFIILSSFPYTLLCSDWMISAELSSLILLSSPICC